MTLLAAERLFKKFDDQIILNDVSFTVQSRDRIGLVGRNGSGKTTLFEIMTGSMDLDRGSIVRSKSCRIDYIEQEKTEHLESTVFDFVAAARGDLLSMRRDIEALEHELQLHPHDTVSLDRLGQLQSHFEGEGGFNFENEVKIILEGLGFPVERHRDRIKSFSGGEKNRAGLARALAGNGNLLLLDEPTNHLDIESTRWLEEYLSSLERSYIIVSHDRAFLTAAVNRVWEISNGKIDSYTGGFEQFLNERQQRRQLQQHHYEHQQAEIKRIEEFVRRNMAGQKTKQAQSKLKYLNRIKRIQAPKSERQPDAIRLHSSGRSFAHVLSVEGVSLAWGTDEVVRDITFDIYRGDKVGLIGQNGSGKSTILKALVGEISPVRGEIRLGANVDVAYFDQELVDLDLDITVLNSIWEVDPMVEIGKMRSFLARFGFTGEDCFKRVSTLSGGEKTKLSLARLLYHPANLIIFDEPTNNLDLDSREALEKALQEYDGSCLVVSHDRYFLDHVVDKILYISNAELETFNGNYSYFKEKTSGQAPVVKVKSSERKQEYLTFKEKSKQRARLKKDLKATHKRIAAMEAELERTINDLQENIPKTDWEKLDETIRRKKELEDNLMQAYHDLERLEEIELD